MTGDTPKYGMSPVENVLRERGTRLELATSSLGS